MISALEPRFEKLESKEKDAKRRQIDRYVLQGEVISLMLAHTPGLVVTVSDLITTPEEHQAPDIVIAANDLRSLQHGSHSYKGVATARLPTPDTLDLDGALQGSGNGSTEGRQVSCGDNAGSVLRSCYLPTSGIGRLEPDQQGFPGHLDVLQDRQTSDSTMDGLVLINQVSSVDGFDSQQLQIADGLFLSDFMQEYRGIM
ncbi:unnamed protein product [Alternaria alternata]